MAFFLYIGFMMLIDGYVWPFLLILFSFVIQIFIVKISVAKMYWSIDENSWKADLSALDFLILVGGSLLNVFFFYAACLKVFHF